MTAEQVLARLEGDGFVVLVNNGSLIVGPASGLSDNMRELISTHKPKLLELIDARPYVGWWRMPKCRWQSVVRGKDERDAWRRLLIYERPSSHCEIMVLPAGRHPKDN